MDKKLAGSLSFMILGHRCRECISCSKGNSVRQVHGLPKLVEMFARERGTGYSVSEMAIERCFSQIDGEIERRSCFFVAPLVRSEPAGYILCYDNYPLMYRNIKNCFYIAEEYVAENMRRTGIYSATLDIVLEEAKKIGKKTVYKEVIYNNNGARIASLRNGFREVRKADPKAGIDYTLMARKV